MSEPSAITAALTPSPPENWLAEPKRSEGWSRNKFIFWVVFALAFHLALIVLFGTKKQIVPRAVTKVPHLRLVDSANEFIALNDPTLFARPNAHDLVTAFWRRPPAVAQPDFNYSAAPRYLPPAPENFGAAFHEFMRSRPPAEFPLNFKPEPKSAPPSAAFADSLPQTIMQITGELAQRQLLNPSTLPAIPVNDVIAPSRVQVLVDPAGNVASAVLLPADNALEDAGRSPKGDAAALATARTLRFAPAPQLMFGEIIFHWHTVPLTTTNAP